MRLTGRLIILLVLAALSLFPAVSRADNGINIPASHPLLWWTSARLAQARAYYAAHPLPIPESDDPYGCAFYYLMTGNTTYAHQAIQWAVDLTADTTTSDGADYARWDGEDVFLVYDWCYDQMQPADKQTLFNRWNAYIAAFNQYSWGGPDMPSNNYYQGFMRNTIEWGMAAYHEPGNQSQAQAFIDEGLITRWQNSSLPYFSNDGRGGVPPEGTQYGAYTLYYLVVPFTTMGLMGRDIIRETNFYKEALFYLIYSTSTAPMYVKDNSVAPYYQLYPFGDDEFNPFPPAATVSGDSPEYGDFVTLAANEWQGTRVGGYARKWLHRIVPVRSSHVIGTDVDAADHDFSDLPLDYYAPGGQKYLFVKNSWDAAATSLLIQTGFPDSHGHLDWGSFQIRRGQRWLTKETTGYDDLATGFGGNGTTSSEDMLDHNGLVFTGRGWTIGPASGYQDGNPKMLRMESQPDYAYACVDLSLAYQARTSNYTNPDGSPRDDNPFAKTVIREFIFIRALETLVVLDRLESAPDSKWGPPVTAAQVIKTFILHSLNIPVQQDANHVLMANGEQSLRLTTLLPASPNYIIVDDQKNSGRGADYSDWYQQRLELNDSGQAQSYFINVLQARGTGAADVTATLTQDAATFYILLSHPTLGKAVINLPKGMTSTGGQVGYSATGMPATLSVLTNSVEDIGVTDNGPVWGIQPPAIVPSNYPTSSPTPAQAANIPARAYPNPFSLSKNTVISFTNIALPAVLHLYSMDGSLVISKKITSDPNFSPKNLSPGIYLYIIKGQAGTKKGKLAIVR